MTTDQILTETELAERWKISVSSIQKWRGRGLGAAYLDIGMGTIRYRLADVLEYEESRVMGGYIAPRARKLIARAAAFFNIIIGWKLGDETRAMITAMVQELHQVTMENHAPKKPVDIPKAPTDNTN